MKELLEKISSYNIFNYLLPGALCAVLATRVTSYDITQDDLLIGAFVYYFIGLVVSRVGSLLVEPLLKWTRFVEFAPYRDFVATSAKDPKLEVLLEVNNMYRTLLSLFLVLACLIAFDLIADRFTQVRALTNYLLIAGLVILFALSYRKQTGYIKQRIEASES